ncbi:MAG: tRNA pseudouridine(38-40) synthase TruA [Actinobacteria bacterium]|nr:tRNA pseudouridine(38-40) synthase TruA [Actinomycetota bacterium]
MKEPTLEPEGGFFRLRIDFAYDGTNFSGWAKQRDQKTIQGEMESALEPITRNPISLQVAGRTDAGVHALAQVAHFDLPERDHQGHEWDLADITYRLNRILPEDIRVHSITKAPQYFHARFSALSRSYIYKILDDGQTLPPLLRYDTATWYRPLDLDAMNEAVNPLLGEHDFAAFCKARESGTSIRTLKEFAFERDSMGVIIAKVKADAFCHSMVRSLIGAAVCVGEARFSPTWMKEVLDGKTRIGESLVFPARGLTLTKVEYPEDLELKERLSITVRRRDEDE